MGTVLIVMTGLVGLDFRVVCGVLVVLSSEVFKTFTVDDFAGLLGLFVVTRSATVDASSINGLNEDVTVVNFLNFEPTGIGVVETGLLDLNSKEVGGIIVEICFFVDQSVLLTDP